MRTRASVILAAVIFGTGAFATEAKVNAAASRRPISPAIYAGALGDPQQQAQLAATYGIALPNPELARIALLGTFGQQGVAGEFPEGPVQPEQGAAISLFTNYDGQGGRFGDTSIQTQTTHPELSVFASFDLDAKVTVVLLNKSPSVSDAVVLGFQGMGQKGNWRAFELTAAGAIVAAGTGTLYDAVLTRTVQPYSALLIEYRPVGGILPVREPSAAEPVPAAEGIAPPAAAAPMGCSATDVGFLSLGLLVLVGFVRGRATN